MLKPLSGSRTKFVIPTSWIRCPHVMHIVWHVLHMSESSSEFFYRLSNLHLNHNKKITILLAVFWLFLNLYLFYHSLCSLPNWGEKKKTSMGIEPWFSKFLVKNSNTRLSDHWLFDGSLILVFFQIIGTEVSLLLGFSPNRYLELVFPWISKF